ncbi:MAG: hypothetical protein ACI30R_07695 [Sodaliphilus sp.]
MMKKIYLMLAMLVVSATAAMAQDVYVVAGCAELCGSIWNTTDPDNQMTLQSDGTYAKTFTNVAVDTDYAFKVVKNGGEEWIGNSDGSNVVFSVTSVCDVTISFNPSDYAITVSGSGVVFSTFEVNQVVAVGDGNGNWLNGASWNPAAEVNKMTETSTGVYDITYSDMAAGTYHVKFALNGSWTHNFGGSFTAFGEVCDATYEGGEIEFTVPDGVGVHLQLNLSNFDFPTKSGAKFKIEILTEPTGINDLTVSRAHAVKKIQNGQVVIEHNGKTYNAAGAQIK